MTIATGKLRSTALSILRDKVEKLNKRAARIGLNEMVVRVVSTEKVKTKNPSGLYHTDIVSKIELDGCPPCINGWSVAARIEFTDCGNLVHCAPGAGSVDHAWKTAPNVCEHCNTKRRRNDVIVIRNTDGREITVGRNCLADYIRSEDAEALIEYAKWLGNAGCMISECMSEYDDYHGPRAKPMEEIETVIAASSICIRKLGWVSGREAYDSDKGSTKNDVFSLLFPPYDSGARAEWRGWIERNDLIVNDYDRDLAGKALAWAKSLEPGDSEYLHNLEVLANSEMIGLDKFGYAASIIPAYNRACDRETERAERAADKGRKEFFGSPKVRARAVTATCTGLKSFEGNYGVTTMVRFEHRIDSDSYAVLTWFASGDKTEDFEPGTEYTFDATCKKHEDHDKYGKQTMINRVTVCKG